VYTSTGYRICSLSTRNFPIRPYLFYVRRAVFAVSIQAETQLKTGRTLVHPAVGIKEAGLFHRT
ncbi:hypothetical protein, partial [Escherichia coli]|uniref:hypothetical protein n=1 Tax=Escherichia coli TaxID=562 RepID=UPI001BD6B444